MGEGIKLLFKYSMFKDCCAHLLKKILTLDEKSIPTGNCVLFCLSCKQDLGLIMLNALPFIHQSDREVQRAHVGCFGFSQE